MSIFTEGMAYKIYAKYNKSREDTSAVITAYTNKGSLASPDDVYQNIFK